MTIKGTQWFVQIIKQTHSSHNQNSYEILSYSVGPLDELLSVGNFPPVYVCRQIFWVNRWYIWPLTSVLSAAFVEWGVSLEKPENL